MRHCIVFLSFFIISQATAQDYVTGRVVDATNDSPLVGANVYWESTTVGTYTNAFGMFQLEWPKDAHMLTASFVGYTTTTIHVHDAEEGLVISLEKDVSLGEVVIEEHVGSKRPITLDPLQIEHITQRELKKAACCNLSESFETNPSVDVNFADAITGAKKVMLLGLDGVFSLMTTENIPDIRGLSAPFGLTAVPGPWIESIQLAKGMGSVVNGYESITGQINVELIKPFEAPAFHFNGYANHLGRFETSINGRFKLSDKLSTVVLLHSNGFQSDVDANGDQFLDMPKINQFVASNRWMFYNDVVESQFGFEVLTEQRQAGHLEYTKGQALNTSLPWGMEVAQQRVKAYAKFGILPTDAHPERSLGIINQFSDYKQDGNYGLKQYQGRNSFWYTNLIFQDQLLRKGNTIKAGASFFLDSYREILDDELNSLTYDLSRHERGLGAFAEYSYAPNVRFSMIAGARIDHNNIFGTFLTPRFHLRYKVTRNLTYRMSAGSGQRTPNVLVDNTRTLVSSRKIILPTNLAQEKAWNLGNSLVWETKLNRRDALITLDAYHTEFESMLVMDMDYYQNELRFYNLDGRAYSTVAQLEVNYELLKGLDLRASYKWQDVRATYFNAGLQSMPFVATGIALFNAGYATANKHWTFDATAVHTTPGRVSQSIKTDGFDMPHPFWRVSGQITLKINDFDVYLGGENLTGFTQENPIIDVQDPFGPGFDAGNVWGPIFGRMVYLGVRYTHF